MTTRQGVAAAFGATALAFGGFLAADEAGLTPLSVTETTTVAVPTPLPQALAVVPCTAITMRGEIANPCEQLTLTWEQSNRNALATMAYYPKWKAASPGEYAMLRTWGTSPETTPEPTARSAFGALVRYHLTVCRAWTPDLARCLLP